MHRVGLLDAILDELDHDLVRDELAVAHDRLGLTPDIGLRAHRCTQHIPGRKLGDTEALHDTR